MKNIITILILLVGCATTPTVKSVTGTYGSTQSGDIWRSVLLDDGIFEDYKNGKKHGKDNKWKITKDGELHFEYDHAETYVFRINKDCSITDIARISKDGKRKDIPKEQQMTWKKIK